jgi:hypothetical protein
MPNLARTAGKTIALLAMLTAVSACAPGQPRVVSDSDCIERPIDSAEEAERRAVCYLRTVSDFCTVDKVTDGFRREVVLDGETWRLRSIPPVASCSTWVVELSAKDGQLIRFEKEQ